MSQIPGNYGGLHPDSLKADPEISYLDHLKPGVIYLDNFKPGDTTYSDLDKFKTLFKRFGTRYVIFSGLPSNKGIFKSKIYFGALTFDPRLILGNLDIARDLKCCPE